MYGCVRAEFFAQKPSSEMLKTRFLELLVCLLYRKPKARLVWLRIAEAQVWAGPS